MKNKSFIKKIIWSFIIKLIGDKLKLYIKGVIVNEYNVYGNNDRLIINRTAVVNNALFNTVSGKIEIHEDVFFGHNVCILTGTHDYTKYGSERQTAIPSYGRDIIIEKGAWIASNSKIIGPCTIGENSVVAAGSVVIKNVDPFTIVGGNPAKIIKRIE